MSTITPTFCRTCPSIPVRDKALTLDVQSDTIDETSRMWRQVDAILKNTIVGSGLSVPESRVGDTGQQKDEIGDKVLVAPGIVMKKSEYNLRFGDIDLESYRKRMSPEVFKAFVRHVGALQGKAGLDIVELTSSLED